MPTAQQGESEASGDYNQPQSPRQHPLRFDRHIEQNPPRSNPNHYSGEQGFANYGYILINGQWVDPDSEGEIFDAFNSHADSSQFQNAPIEISAPYSMTQDQMNALYKELFCDVPDPGSPYGDLIFTGDFGDFEGDPRALYISPATFARWAAGVSRGDSYVRTKVEIKVSDPEISQMKDFLYSSVQSHQFPAGFECYC
jgi:hypothetical protein